jgi:hypothetical protein
MRGQPLDESPLDNSLPHPNRERLRLECHDGTLGKRLLFPVEEPVHQHPRSRDLLQFLLDVVEISQNSFRDRAVPHPVSKHNLGQ